MSRRSGLLSQAEKQEDWREVSVCFSCALVHIGKAGVGKTESDLSLGKIGRPGVDERNDDGIDGIVWNMIVILR